MTRSRRLEAPPKVDPDWDKLESAAPPPGRPILDSLAPAQNVHRQKSRRRPGWAIATRSKSAIDELKKKAAPSWVWWNPQGNYWWVDQDGAGVLREVFANFDEMLAKASPATLI